MKVITVIATCALVGALWAPAAMAQEESEPPQGQGAETAQDPAVPDPAAPDSTPAPSEEPPQKKKMPLGLYVYAGYGSGDPDSFNTSIVTSATSNSENTMDIDDVSYARMAVGWRLPNKKGDFRLIFDGFSEQGYTYDAIGRQATLPTSGNVSEDLVWWNTTIQGGQLQSIKKPPRWTSADDLNGNMAADQNEVRYDSDEACAADPALGCRNIMKTVTDNMQNRFQNWDIVYGRVWGPRRFQGRWFAGLRYMLYEGNVLASAWLNTAFPGQDYSDGTFVRLLNFNQKMSGIGPTGLLEARWNFFGQKLQVYLNGQVAFLISSIETDTGQFFTLVNQQNPESLVPLPARLNETRDKSVWNTKVEVGLRFKMKSGLAFDLAYMYQGYLDAVLNPETIQIPATIGQSQQAVSAVYNTQDIVLDAWRLGVGFQF